MEKEEEEETFDSSTPIQDPITTSDAQKFFEVQNILEWQWVENCENREREFLVKWKGYPKNEATWEPESNLEGAREVLDKFLRRKRLPLKLTLIAIKEEVDKSEGDEFTDTETKPIIASKKRTKLNRKTKLNKKKHKYLSTHRPKRRHFHCSHNACHFFTVYPANFRRHLKQMHGTIASESLAQNDTSSGDTSIAEQKAIVKKQNTETIEENEAIEGKAFERSNSESTDEEKEGQSSQQNTARKTSSKALKEKIGLSLRKTKKARICAGNYFTRPLTCPACRSLTTEKRWVMRKHLLLKHDLPCTRNLFYHEGKLKKCGNLISLKKKKKPKAKNNCGARVASKISNENSNNAFATVLIAETLHNSSLMKEARTCPICRELTTEDWDVLEGHLLSEHSCHISDVFYFDGSLKLDTIKKLKKQKKKISVGGGNGVGISTDLMGSSSKQTEEKSSPNDRKIATETLKSSPKKTSIKQNPENGTAENGNKGRYPKEKTCPICFGLSTHDKALFENHLSSKHGLRVDDVFLQDGSENMELIEAFKISIADEDWGPNSSNSTALIASGSKQTKSPPNDRKTVIETPKSPSKKSPIKQKPSGTPGNGSKGRYTKARTCPICTELTTDDKALFEDHFSQKHGCGLDEVFLHDGSVHEEFVEALKISLINEEKREKSSSDGNDKINQILLTTNQISSTNQDSSPPEMLDQSIESSSKTTLENGDKLSNPLADKLSSEQVKKPKKKTNTRTCPFCPDFTSSVPTIFYAHIRDHDCHVAELFEADGTPKVISEEFRAKAIRKFQEKLILKNSIDHQQKMPSQTSPLIARPNETSIQNRNSEETAQTEPSAPIQITPSTPQTERVSVQNPNSEESGQKEPSLSIAPEDKQINGSSTENSEGDASAKTFAHTTESPLLIVPEEKQKQGIENSIEASESADSASSAGPKETIEVPSCSTSVSSLRLSTGSKSAESPPSTVDAHSNPQGEKRAGVDPQFGSPKRSRVIKSESLNSTNSSMDFNGNENSQNQRPPGDELEKEDEVLYVCQIGHTPVFFRTFDLYRQHFFDEHPPQLVVVGKSEKTVASSIESAKGIVIPPKQQPQQNSLLTSPPPSSNKENRVTQGSTSQQQIPIISFPPQQQHQHNNVDILSRPIPIVPQQPPHVQHQIPSPAQAVYPAQNPRLSVNVTERPNAPPLQSAPSQQQQHSHAGHLIRNPIASPQQSPLLQHQFPSPRSQAMYPGQGPLYQHPHNHHFHQHYQQQNPHHHQSVTNAQIGGGAMFQPIPNYGNNNGNLAGQMGPLGTPVVMSLLQSLIPALMTSPQHQQQMGGGAPGGSLQSHQVPGYQPILNPVPNQQNQHMGGGGGGGTGGHFQGPHQQLPPNPPVPSFLPNPMGYSVPPPWLNNNNNTPPGNIIQQFQQPPPLQNHQPHYCPRHQRQHNQQPPQGGNN